MISQSSYQGLQARQETIFQKIELQIGDKKDQKYALGLGSGNSLDTTNESKATSLSDIIFRGQQEVQVIRRQYEICLQKQNELKQLIRMKFESQIANLTNTNNELKKQVQQYKQKLKSNPQNLPNDSIVTGLDSDTKSIVFYQRLLTQLEKQHSQCLNNKKILLDQKETLQMKLKMLQTQNVNLQNEVKRLREENRNVEDMKIKLNAQQAELERIKRSAKQREIEFIRELDQLKEVIRKVTETEKINTSCQSYPMPQLQPNNTQIGQKSQFAHNLQQLIKERQITAGNFQNLDHCQNHLKLLEISNKTHLRGRSLTNRRSACDIPVKEDKDVINVLYKKGLQFFNNENKNKEVQSRKYQNFKSTQCNYQTTFPVEINTPGIYQPHIGHVPQINPKRRVPGDNVENRRYKYL